MEQQAEQRGEVTQLLLSLQSGDRSSLDRLTPLLYPELRRLAQVIFRRERPDHTIQPTALVHEAYLKLVDQSQATWQTKAHFLGIAARVMRQLLVSHSRQHNAAKRGSGVKVALDEQIHGSVAGSDPEILDLHEALEALAALDPRKAEVIEMRYFGGLTGEEIAEALAISTATVARELRTGQAWLLRHMQKADDAGTV